MHLWSHFVAEKRPPLANLVADCRGCSGAIRIFVATVAPIRKPPRATHAIFGGMGVYHA